MTDLKRTGQQPGNVPTGRTPPGEQGEHDRRDELGAREPATAGTDRDADRSGEAKNQGHGHPRR